MKQLFFVFFALTIFLSAGYAGTEDNAVFGPKNFDVINRDGEENRFVETFQAADGRYLIKVQNGESPKKGSVFIKLNVNGQAVLKDDRYSHPFILCIVELKKQNSLELVLKDGVPTSAKPPKPPARVTIVSVLPLNLKWPSGLYGLSAWEKVGELDHALQKIKNAEASSLALRIISLKQGVEARAEAMRGLSDRKDPAALDLIKLLHLDTYLQPEIRAEAAIGRGALQDKEAIAELANGLLDEQELIRVGSARALTFYPEQDIQEPLIKVLQTLDSRRWGQTIAAVSTGGLKTVDTFMKLAESPDYVVQNIGMLLVGGTKTQQALEYLKGLLAKPGKRDRKLIIMAMGASRSLAAVEPLSAIARDASARKGVEVELAKALADIGDKQSAPVIAEMINAARPGRIRAGLRAAYQQLTGKRHVK